MHLYLYLYIVKLFPLSPYCKLYHENKVYCITVFTVLLPPVRTEDIVSESNGADCNNNVVEGCPEGPALLIHDEDTRQEDKQQCTSDYQQNHRYHRLHLL